MAVAISISMLGAGKEGGAEGAGKSKALERGQKPSLRYHKIFLAFSAILSRTARGARTSVCYKRRGRKGMHTCIQTLCSSTCSAMHTHASTDYAHATYVNDERTVEQLPKHV